MENTKKPQNVDMPEMCIVCASFYGNPSNGGFCSKCYKDSVNFTKVAEKEIKSGVKLDFEVEKAEEEEMVKQEDHTRCWTCTKKAGLMGFKCKCGYTYCKKHRLPEKHTCDFNFQKEGKSRLSKKNPNIQSDKIERI